MKTLRSVFGTDRPVIGMLHLAGWNPETVVDTAREEARILYDSGVNAVLVQNYFGNSVDAYNVLTMLDREFPGKCYGVNLKGNPRLGFQYARQCHAAFLQIDSVCGHLTPENDRIFARELEQCRSQTDAFLMGGVRFKYQPYLSGRPLRQDLELAMQRCDAIVVTGEGTGVETDLIKIRSFREILGTFPLIVDAGVTADNVRQQLKTADGAIVGSYFKEFGRTENRMDPLRVKKLMDQVRGPALPQGF